METIFVNRSDDLRFLKSELSESRVNAALIILVAPTGFGKSRLTEQLSLGGGLSHAVLIVDPSVRGSDRIALHNGFFLQKCAEVISEAATAGKGPWPSLEAFLKERRWRTVKEKRILDALKEAPSRGSLYKVGVDYASRLFGLGRFSVAQVTSSDDATAVGLCEDFIDYVLSRHEMTLVLREAQHVDAMSLSRLLHWNAFFLKAHLVFEYTTEDGMRRLLPAHQKAFLRAAEANPNYRIKPLSRLSPGALQAFIGSNVDARYVVSPSIYDRWRGNLNDVLESLHVERSQESLPWRDDVAYVLENPISSMRDRLVRLSDLQQYVLAVVFANVEAADRWSVSQAIAYVYPQTSQSQIEQAVTALVEEHGLLRTTDHAVRFSNETIADVVGELPPLRRLLIIAEEALRVHYGRLVDEGAYGPLGSAMAIRQFFRLSGRTRDTTALMKATRALTEEVKRSQDQAIYIDIVADALKANADLAIADGEHLRRWAACIAYDVGEWERCVGLLQSPAATDVFSRAMSACALQEIGEHDASLALAETIEKHARTTDERLTGGLIKALVVGCLGKHADARLLLNALIENGQREESPLLGYAHRFFEIVGDYEEVLEHLKKSMDCFERSGFAVSRAYSQLAATVLLARSGDISGARTWAREAAETLANEIHDRHIILNNRAAIELLDDEPDCSACCDHLAIALRSSRDDFSDMTILSNLGIAYCRQGRTDDAVGCAEKVLAILRQHDFADRDIYWPACFNAATILRRGHQPKAAEEAMAFPARFGKPASVNVGYWRYRYQGGAPEPSFAFLASREFHPLYLSHWLIDREGLDLLRRGSPR